MSLPEEFKRRAYQATPDCAIGAVAVTLGTELETPSRGLYIGGEGSIAVVMANGDEVTFAGAIAGALYPISVKLVKSSGTTATNIIATY